MPQVVVTLTDEEIANAKSDHMYRTSGSSLEKAVRGAAYNEKIVGNGKYFLLDLSYRDPSKLVAELRNKGYTELPDRIEAQIPVTRMEEPKIFRWVMANTHGEAPRLFVRWSDNDSFGQEWVGTQGTVAWDDLNDPEPYKP